MKLTTIILIIMSLLFIAGCSQGQSPLGAVSTLNDFQKDFYESEAAPEYRTYANMTLTNTSGLSINESITLSYGSPVNMSKDDLSTVTFYDTASGTAVGSGNYTVNYQTGNVTLNSYQIETVTNETINLTNATGGKNVTYNTYGVVGTPVLFNQTSGAVIGAGNYTFTAATGNLLLLNGSFAYNNLNVGINYTYNNASWVVYAVYQWYNKLKINCTPAEIETGTIDAFINELRFISIGAERRVQLWIGDYVVNSTDGGSVDANNLMGKGWYVENVTDSDTIRFGKPMWASDEQFVLRIDDSSAAAGYTVLVDALCKYRVR